MNIKTIEEKAKAYDEALNWIRELYPGLHGATKEDAEHYFPELRESEDERIRKGMIRFLESEQAEGMFTHEARLSWIAYLEKQKDHFRDDTKMVEQKPAENGVDVIKTSALLAADRLASAEMTGRLKERSEILENPEEYGLQKPAEWSEEFLRLMGITISQDGNQVCVLLGENLAEGIAGFGDTLADAVEEFKKEWRQFDRFRKATWKPSEEQIGALNYAYCELFKREDVGHNILGPLQILLDNLKRLM